MKLSEIGKFANQFLMEIPERYDYAILDEFVVMPNHVHVILLIEKINDGHNVGVRNAINRVSTSTELENSNSMETKENPKIPGGITENKNPMLHDNISRILNWYKGRLTFESRKINPDFAWQSRFYDHIIRNDKSYQRIKNYIINNPRNCKEVSIRNIS